MDKNSVPIVASCPKKERVNAVEAAIHLSWVNYGMSLKNGQNELRAYEGYFTGLYASFPLTYDKALFPPPFSPSPICTQCLALFSAKVSIVIQPWLRFSL